MNTIQTIAYSFILAAGPFSPAFAQATGSSLSDLEAQSIRTVSFDLCLPSTSEEYAALGKHAVVMLTSRSAIATELPLRSVYVLANGIRVPLQRLARTERSQSGNRAEQTSFYLIPIYLTKIDATLEVDFAGERKGFGVATFAANGAFYATDAPAFVRLDEYDNPSEPDFDAVGELLSREYPMFFPG
jgi:hypothetical protein